MSAEKLEISSPPEQTPWRYFAAYYLYQWLAMDKPHYDAFHDGEGITPEKARKMCVTYGVARCFSKKDWPEGEETSLVRFAAHLQALRLIHPPLAVDAVGEWLDGRYEDYREQNAGNSKNSFSAFTKGYWFVLRSPIVILDNLAWQSLEANVEYRRLMKSGIFFGYYAAWRQFFGLHEMAIAEACEWLPSSVFAHRLVNRGAIDKENILNTAHAAWFRERVCDMRLWNGPEMPSAVDLALYLD